MEITLLNILSVIVLIAVVVASILIYRHLKQKTKDAEGFGSVNERGESETSPEGDIVGEV